MDSQLINNRIWYCLYVPIVNTIVLVIYLHNPHKKKKLHPPCNICLRKTLVYKTGRNFLIILIFQLYCWLYCVLKKVMWDAGDAVCASPHHKKIDCEAYNKWVTVRRLLLVYAWTSDRVCYLATWPKRLNCWMLWLCLWAGDGEGLPKSVNRLQSLRTAQWQLP